MNILLFGATGMIGQGVLRECLLDPAVKRVVTVGRRATGEKHAKLKELVVPDVADLSTIENELAGLDACLFCLGVTSAGMSEKDYTAITHDLTLAVAETLVRLNPAMTFVFVSGQGSDSSESGRLMWARVKGRTENALLRMPFKAVYIFRPGGIVPLHGVTSRTKWIRVMLALTRPIHPALTRLFPNHVTTTEELGRAMITVARDGHSKPVLETRDIRGIG
jgi:uncharacterized protein YbjT (DUF2867 family)